MSNKMRLALKWFGIFLLGKVLEKILDESGFTKGILSVLPNQSSFYKFLTLSVTITIWNIVLFIALLIPSYFFISALFKRFISKKEGVDAPRSKQEVFYEAWDKFKQENRFNKIVEKENVAFKTDLNWAGSNMQINSLFPYCIKHQDFARMAIEAPNSDFYKCHKPDCNNSIGSFWIKKAETEILSNLENKWTKLNVETSY